MKFSFVNLTKQKGLAQIPIILGLLLMAIAIPIATKLSQQEQDTRQLAASCPVSAGGSCGSGDAICCGSSMFVCAGGTWTMVQSCPNGCDGTTKCKTTSCNLEYGSSGGCGEDKPGATCSDKQKPVQVRSPSSNCEWHWTCLNKSECETSECIPNCGLNFTYCKSEKFDGGCGMDNACTGTKNCDTCTEKKEDEGCGVGTNCDDASWGEKWKTTNCSTSWKCYPNDSRCVSQVTPTATTVPEKCVVSKFDCSANALWKCVRTDGVADWEMVEDCDLNGSTCSVDVDKFAGRCETSIPSTECTTANIGQKRCVDLALGIDGYKTCKSNGSWSSTISCGIGKVCESGECINLPDCNSSNVGAKRCVDLALGIDGYKTCKSNGSWSSAVSCGIGKVCESGECIGSSVTPTPTKIPSPTPTCGELNQTCCPPNPPESYDNHCNTPYLKCGNGNKCVSTSTPICGENGQTCCPPNPPYNYSNYCNNSYLTCGSDNKCKSTSAIPTPTVPYVPGATLIPSTGPLPTVPQVTPVPTSIGAPPPGPTNPPNPPANCSYDSLQARVQPDITVDWNTQLSLASGEKVNLGCMHDGSGELAENVTLVAEHSSGSKNEFNQNLMNQWEAPKTGNYTIWCKSTDSQCTGLVSSTNATLSVGSVCKECPNDFHCYGPADDKVEFGYAWFATGYHMEGYVAQVPDSYCEDSGLVKPQWIGKGSGDANCDGKLDVADTALWRNEFADISQGDKVYRQDWEADFTGTDGVCDGYVDLGDYSLWRAKFSLYSGGDN